MKRSTSLSRSLSDTVRAALFLVAGMLLTIGVSTTLAADPTTSPPDGSVNPYFTSLEIENSDSAVSKALNVTKTNAGDGDTGIHGKVKVGTSYYGASLGYVKGTDPYGIYTSKDVLFTGNTYLDGSVYLEQNVYATGSEIRISAADLWHDGGDFHVDDGQITADEIGYFYFIQEYSTDWYSIASCDSGDTLIACGGFSADTDETNTYYGSYPKGETCYAKREDPAHDGIAKIQAQAFCFSADG